jgi:hypothetical protein
MPSFKRTVDIATILLAGYKGFKSLKLALPILFTALTRLKVLNYDLVAVPRQTSSRRYYFETYAAYGFKDERWKYFLSATYSLNNKSIYKFPQNYIKGKFSARYKNTWGQPSVCSGG